MELMPQDDIVILRDDPIGVNAVTPRSASRNHLIVLNGLAVIPFLRASFTA
jgi:hypothetical protein